MRPSKFRQIVWSIIIGAAIGLALMGIAIARTPKVHADTSDQQFVIDLTARGYEIHNMSALITRARMGCIAAISNHNQHLIADYIWPGSSDLTREQVSEVAMVAAMNFCPIVSTYQTPNYGTPVV